MKQYIKVNNKAEINTLLVLYKTLDWRANISGLVARSREEGSYPIVVGHCDGYSWYLNDHGNDGKHYLSVKDVVKIHNSLSYEKKIYIPYHYRDVLSRTSRKISVHNLEEMFREGRLNENEKVSIRYVEKTPVEGSGDGRIGFPTNQSTWQHFECAFKNFKKVNFSTIDSYTQVGKIRFVGDQRMSNSLRNDYWEVIINLPEAYEEQSTGNISEKYIEITDCSIVNPHTFAHPDIKIDSKSRLEPSNYIYYTLFL